MKLLLGWLQNLFVLVGDGPKFNVIRNSVSDQSKIRFLGQQKNIESIINVFDICILSTFSEGISNSIMEYMALSKPVIATSGGGTNEIVEDGITGYLINKRNPQELVNRISYLLNNPETGKLMGRKGKQRIIDEFGINKMIESYYKVYCELV
jgi:glycosyltransferase involved in cell wall biosynthesis